jgi:hypothetical protein
VCAGRAWGPFVWEEESLPIGSLAAPTPLVSSSFSSSCQELLLFL